MTDCSEIAITSDASDQFWTCCAWDVRTGTQLFSYKGGGAPGSHTMAIINNQYILTGNIVKPMLYIWPINKYDAISTRFILSGRPTAVAVTPDGNYCLVAVAETIYIYQLVTGVMLAAVSRHYQTVNVLRMTDDGSHFVSAGQDGMVLVWNLSRIVRIFQKQTIDPLYVFSKHALPVTDLCIGQGGMKAMMCSVSLDRTCKLYDLASGTMLLNTVFQEPLTSVQMDIIESNIFIGTNNGLILRFAISSPPRVKECDVDHKQQQNMIFQGHKKAVTCLAVSMDGKTLLSGSVDENVIVWHIQSRQQIRVIPHKGAITNISFVITPKAMFNQEIKFNPLFQPFHKMVHSIDKNEDLSIDVEVNECTKNTMNVNLRIDPTMKPSLASTDQDKFSLLKREVQHLKIINKELYEFAVRTIMRDS